MLCKLQQVMLELHTHTGSEPGMPSRDSKISTDVLSLSFIEANCPFLRCILHIIQSKQEWNITFQNDYKISLEVSVQ